MIYSIKIPMTVTAVDTGVTQKAVTSFEVDAPDFASAIRQVDRLLSGLAWGDYVTHDWLDLVGKNE